MKPLAISIVGRKGSGRSEVLVSLIRHLAAARLRVGVIKHLAREDFEIDLPGKDTYEYRAQGAGRVMISGKKRLAVFANLEEETALPELLRQFEDFDLVFLEGYFDDELPKIEIHRSKAGALLATGISNVIAICTDEHESRPKDSSIPFFSFEEIASLALWIEHHLSSVRKEAHA